MRHRGVPGNANACVHSCRPPRRAREPERYPRRLGGPADSRHRARRPPEDRDARRLAGVPRPLGQGPPELAPESASARASWLHRSGGSHAMTVRPPEQLLAILVCPKCKGDLEYVESESVLVCHRDRLRYPVRDGIPVMLIDEAKSF